MNNRELVKLSDSGSPDDSSRVEEHAQGSTNNDQEDEVRLFAKVLALPLPAMGESIGFVISELTWFLLDISRRFHH